MRYVEFAPIKLIEYYEYWREGDDSCYSMPGFVMLEKIITDERMSDVWKRLESIVIKKQLLFMDLDYSMDLLVLLPDGIRGVDKLTSTDCDDIKKDIIDAANKLTRAINKIMPDKNVFNFIRGDLSNNKEYYAVNQVIKDIKEHAKEILDTGSCLAKPNDSNAERKHFLITLETYFRKNYGQPLNPTIAILTKVLLEGIPESFDGKKVARIIKGK